MNVKLAFLLGVPLLLTGCATPTMFNINDSDIKTMSDNSVGTYSDYGGDVTRNNQDGFYHLKVYVGGLASCDGGVLLYAKPKLDEFMKSNGFTSYKVVKGEYSLFPLSKCELFIQFNK